MSPRVENMTAFRGSRIGILTVPRQRIEITPDAIVIQRALTAKPRSFDRHDVIAMAGCLAAGLAVMTLAWAGRLP